MPSSSTIRAAIDAEYANRLILAEANQWPADVRPYFGDGDECHMAFHFPLMPRIYMALRQEDRLPITDIMAQTPPIPDTCQWGLFLRNHDELTLEMVTADERDYMYFAYSADPRMRVNVGIRRRLAPLVDNNRRRIELLNSLLLSFPGTPILYYGDEIGMGDNIYLGDRNGVRTPMQWTSDRNAGFSSCDPARLYFPVIMDPIYGYQVVNVEAQLSDQSSLLHWTRNMIALRKLFQVFGRGTLTISQSRQSQDPRLSSRSGSRRRLARNRALRRQPQPLCAAGLAGSLRVCGHGAGRDAWLCPVPTITEEPYALSLAPYSFLWLELQPATAQPEPFPQLATDAAEPEATEYAVALDLLTKGWPGWFAGHGIALLASTLPAWLPNQRWFGAKTRAIQSIRVMDWVELPAAVAANTTILPASKLPSASTVPPVLLYVEISYTEGESEIYQLPLAFSTGLDAEQIAATSPQSIVATLSTPTGAAVLHDGTVREDTRQGLLALIERNATLPLSTMRTAALEVAASLAAAATGQSARASIAGGGAAELLQHPERATHGPASGAAVHLRPHEIFPAATATATDARLREHEGIEAPVAPVPLDTQPGEAATPSRSSVPGESSAAQRIQLRESPTAGEPALQTGSLDARSSAVFTGTNRELPSRIVGTEQSNTSIIYGEEFILKFFRRLQPGENPEIEIGRYLTETAKFTHIPPFMGEISITPAKSRKDERRDTAGTGGERMRWLDVVSCAHRGVFQICRRS